MIVHTDSTVIKGIINKGRSTNVYVNHLLRRMAWMCARINCRLSAVHVAGAINMMADAISRLQEGRGGQLLMLLSSYHHGRSHIGAWQQHMSSSAYAFLCGRS